MDNKLSLKEMLKRALINQVEMGLEQAVIGPIDIQESRQVVSVSSAIDNSEFQTAEKINFEAAMIKSSYKSIQVHREAICNCQLCPLGQTRNKFVYGVGNPKADVLFVGEAPGLNEDKLGEPFVGRSGELLDKILAAIQFSRQDIYIANILKCRPPNNRDPLPEEMELCFPYLKEQVALLKPKIICALGRVAGQALLNTTTPLGKLRGQWHEFEGVPLMLTYHPAALLRFPSYKRDTWEDMKMLKAKYDSF